MISFINAQQHKRLLSNQFSCLNHMTRRRVGKGFGRRHYFDTRERSNRFDRE
jgi:hypothetical protein